VVKNKVAPPFFQAEFDIMANEGISKTGDILDVALKLELIRKSGAWYYLGDDRLGQGRENVKGFLQENPNITAEIDRMIRAQMVAQLASPPETASNGEASAKGQDEKVET
jgi:recombination protein RecA